MVSLRTLPSIPADDLDLARVKRRAVSVRSKVGLRLLSQF